MLPITYRQAAKILQTVRTNKAASVKRLALEKHVEKKRQTYALAMETLKYSAILDSIITYAGILKDHPDWWSDMIRVLVYDLVMGKGLPHRGLCGEVQKYRKKLNEALKRIKKKNKAQSNLDLLPEQKRMKALPRYVRVNTLKISVEDAIEAFKKAGWEFRSNGTPDLFEKWKQQKELAKKREEKRLARERRKAKFEKGRRKWKRHTPATAEGAEDDEEEAEELREEHGAEESAESAKAPEKERRQYRGIFYLDPHIRHLLVFPPNTPMYNHIMVKRGELVLQDKASCLPAYILLHHVPVDSKLDRRGLPPGELVMDHVLEGGAAPGNKTSCLAAIGRNTVKVVAVEKNQMRISMMKKRLQSLGCEKVTPMEKDFLSLDPAQFKSIKAILLDPSCTGSGIVNRADLPTKKRRRKQRSSSKKSDIPEHKETGTAGEGEDKDQETEDEEEEEGEEEEDVEDDGEEGGEGEEHSENGTDEGGSAEEAGGSDGEELSEDSGTEDDGKEPHAKDAKRRDNTPEAIRIRKLAAFQKKMVRHALKFPSVDRVVYSTCSIHEEENEKVIQAVLMDEEFKEKFKLVNIMPKVWQTRGHPLFENAEHCIRCEPTKDFTNGFFVACIERIRARERKWQERKAQLAEKKRTAEEAFPEQEMKGSEADATPSTKLEQDAVRLAKKLGQLPRKRFRADPKDPANHPKVPYRTQNRCTICSVRGHFSRDCPHRMCTLCKARGHRPEDCPDKAKHGHEPLLNKDGTELTNMAGLVKSTYGMDYKSLKKQQTAKPTKQPKTKKEERLERRKQVQQNRKLQRKGATTKPKAQRRFANKLRKSQGVKRR